MNYDEKEGESALILNKKRKRSAVKRGINCAWSLEDVKNFPKFRIVY